MSTWFANLFPTIDNPWLVLSMDLTVKATLLLLLGVGVVHWQKRSAAAVRHRVWCLTFCGLLLLPLLSAFLPSWRLPLLPAPQAVAESGSIETDVSDVLERPPSSAPPGTPRLPPENGAPFAAQDHEAAVQGRSSYLPQPDEIPSALPASISKPALPSDPVATIESSNPQTEIAEETSLWPNGLFFLWAVGFFMAILPLGVSLFHNWYLGRSSLQIKDRESLQLLDHLCRSLNLNRRLRLLETHRDLIPMTWGIIRPVVLMPHSARNWSAERKRFVLLHELAHIKRYDVAFQMLARLVCSFYWFHPLSWYGLKRLRQERELACDDCVLMTGERPADCAEQLVAIARSCRLLALPSAVAMAETTNLEQRVRALLDHKRSRGPISKKVAGWSLIVAALLITAVAVVRLEAKSPPAESPENAIAETSDNPQKETKQRADNTKEIGLHYRGRVVDPEGQPVAGAKLYFVKWVYADLSQAAFQPLAVTNNEGWFSFRPKPTDWPPGTGPSYYESGSIAAVAEGYGFGAELSFLFETTGEAFQRLNPARRESMKKRLADKNPIIKLVADDTPITGQILDTEGQPIAGATVEVLDVAYSEEGSLDAWEKATKEPKADYYSTRGATAKGMNGPQLRAVIPAATSDAQGKFTLKGIGRDRLVELLIQGPGIETQMVKARTRDGELVTLPHQWGSPTPPGLENQLIERYQPAEFVHIAAPSKPVIGKVIDGDTEKPIAGVRISPGHQGTFSRGGKYWIVTQTDDEGRYRLEGLPIGTRERLYVYPPDDSAYLPGGSPVNTKADEPSVTKDFRLRKGILVRGQAVDDRTGKPLPGQVSYYSEAGNEHLENYPGFRQLYSEYERRANEEGRFEIPVPPGRGIITFLPDDHGTYQRGVGTSTITIPDESQAGGQYYRTVPSYLFSGGKGLLRQVEVAPDSAPLDITLELTSGVQVAGRLVDEEGKPLTGCLINGRINPGAGAFFEVQGTEFQVEGYYPDRPRNIYFYHPDRNLAAHHLLEGEPPEDFTIKLTKAGALRGRLIDEEGAPISGVRFLGEGVPSNNWGDAKLRMATDENGRFEIRGLIPGRKYTVNAYGDMVHGRVLTNVTVEPGETKDVGDVEVGPIPKDDQATAKPQPVPTRIFAKPEAADDETVTVRGRVLLPNGQPARNATVRAEADRLATLKGLVLLGDNFKRAFSTTQTDAEGRFTISVSKRPYGDAVARELKWKDYWKQTTIAASMPGFGPDWAEMADIDPKEPIILKLAQDLPIRGRVVDLEGKPVARLKVQISGPATSENEDLTEWIKAAKAGELPWTLYRHLNKRSPWTLNRHLDDRTYSEHQVGTPNSATTDNEGRFEVRGIGRERMVEMTFESETVAHQSVSVLTRDIPAFERTIVAGNRFGNNKEPVFGAEFTFTAAPSRPIEGTIVDAKTKQPLPGVVIKSYQLANYPIANHRVIETVSDVQGRFRMLGMPKGDGNEIILYPNDDQPYLMREVEVPNPAGLGPVEMTVKLHKGIWIEGKVTDKSTGDPVHARLFFLPYRTNKFAQAVPEFGTQISADGDQTRYETKPDGSYRMVGLPGPAIIGALSLSGHYRQGVGYTEIKGPKQGETNNFDTYANPIFAFPKWPSVMTEIDTPADAKSITVNLEMDPGIKVSFALVDPKGQPLTNVSVAGRFSDTSTAQIQGHTFDAVNFGPDEIRTMLFYHEERKLGRVKRIMPSKEGKAITVKLEPVSMLRGRLFYEDGSPVTGGNLKATPEPQQDFSKELPGRVISDAEGRFEITLYPGAPYTVNLNAAGIGNIGFATIARELEVEPGGTKDLGDLYYMPKNGRFQSRSKAAMPEGK